MIHERLCVELWWIHSVLHLNGQVIENGHLLPVVLSVIFSVFQALKCLWGTCFHGVCVGVVGSIVTVSDAEELKVDS